MFVGIWLKRFKGYVGSSMYLNFSIYFKKNFSLGELELVNSSRVFL